MTWKYRTHFICHLREILQNFMKNFWRYAWFSKILHWLQWKKSNFSKPCDSQEVLERGHYTFFMNFSCYQKYLQQLTRNFMKKTLRFGYIVIFPLKTKIMVCKRYNSKSLSRSRKSIDMSMTSFKTVLNSLVLWQWPANKYW